MSSVLLLRLRRLLRRSRRAWFKLLIIYIAAIIVWDTFRLVLLVDPPQRVSTSSSHLGPNERYFIASIHWNNEAILRSHWNSAVLDLVQFLGPENTFVAVLESGSWDDSKGALRNLESGLEGLGVPHSIVLEDTTHIDEISRIPASGEDGWVWTSRGKKELRRIPYLANLRNRVMNEMTKLEDSADYKPFTKVLWLNDVVFTTEDILTLLNTNSGEYAAACSLDFSKPPLYYDTFALRDIAGNKAITETWPYLLSSTSRSALVSNKPVPVQSCWNGMVAMDAEPFYSKHNPLKFRGVPDSLAELHLEGSECCLVHADNPLSGSKGIWLNPNVRVGYNPAAYDAVNESPSASWPSPFQRIRGMWQNRLARWSGMPRRVFEQMVVNRRVKSWQSTKSADGETRTENGINCLINEMQVLVENGWKHL